MRCVYTREDLPKMPRSIGIFLSRFHSSFFSLCIGDTMKEIRIIMKIAVGMEGTRREKGRERQQND